MVTAIVGVAGTLLGAIVAGVFAHYREKGNHENALKLKELEIEGQREQKWFDDRKEAYADLARITSVINTEKYVIGDLTKSLAMVRMVSNSSMTTDIANGLVNAAKLASKRANEVGKQGKKVSEDQEVITLIEQSREAHAAFLAAVKTELYDAPFDEAYSHWVTGKESEPPFLELESAEPSSEPRESPVSSSEGAGKGAGPEQQETSQRRSWLHKFFFGPSG